MGDFGGTLRSAREQKGISLRHIANATKISVGALEALERNDFSRLPGGIFSRSFVRNYALEVGLDPDHTVAEFLKEAGESFEPPPVIAQEDAPLMPDRPDPALDFRQSWRPTRVFGLRTWALILLFIVIPAAVYFVGKAMKGAAPQAAQPAGASVAPQQQQAAPQQPAPSSAPGAPAGTSTSAATGPIPDLEPGQTMRLVIEPTAECWVSLTVDGEVKLARLLAAGEREMHEVREGAVMRVGDAGAIAFTINGRASKPIGERGVPETIRITRDNFKEFIQ